MGPDSDYILEVRGLASAEDESDGPSQETRRPWIGVQFDCCSVYARAYKNAAGDAYEGQCPGCRRKIRAPISPGGTTARFFRAD